MLEAGLSKKWWRERGFVLHVRRGRSNERFIWLFTYESGLVLYRFQGGPRTYRRLSAYLSPLFPCEILVRRSSTSTWHRIIQLDPAFEGVYSVEDVTPEKLVFLEFCAEVVLRSAPQNQPTREIYTGLHHLLHIYSALPSIWSGLGILWLLYVLYIEGYLSLHHRCRICDKGYRANVKWIWSTEHDLFHEDCAPQARGYVLTERQWSILVRSARSFLKTSPERIQIEIKRFKQAKLLFQHLVHVFESITGNHLHATEMFRMLAFPSS